MSEQWDNEKETENAEGKELETEYDGRKKGERMRGVNVM